MLIQSLVKGQKLEGEVFLIKKFEVKQAKNGSLLPT